MNCSCNAMSLDTDGNCSTKIRKAAKESVCPECGDKIAKGDKYMFSTVFYEDTIRNNKMCLTCYSIVNQFLSEGYYIGDVIDTVRDYLHDYWVDDLPSSCISKLSPPARDMVCDMLQKYQEVEM